MSGLKRAALLLLLTLAAGFLVNQVHPDGLSWFFLEPGGASARAPGIVDADSAFLLLMDGDVAFIDTRPREEFEIDHLPGAISVPLYEFYRNPDLVADLDRSAAYILYCFEPDCLQARFLASEMSRMGFQAVAILPGGASVWLERGYPMESGDF